MDLLVYRRTIWWRSKDRPVARPYDLRDGSSALGEQKTKERGSPVCSTRDQVHLSDERSCRTAGCERGFYAVAGCHAAPEGKGSFCCGYSEDRCRRNWHSTSVRVQAARLRLGSRDCVAVKLLSTQIVRKQAKAIFIFNNAARCMQRRRQRFPTVRTVG